MNKIKKTMAVVLCSVMVTGNLSFTFADSTGKDYEGHWAEATIEKWLTAEKVVGYPDGTFKPNATITRAEFVQMANNLSAEKTGGYMSFLDVKTADWFYSAVSIAHKTGYISGYSNTEFAPNNNITREQAAAILARIQVLDENAAGVAKYSDKNQIAEWAVGDVGAASEAGIVSGYPEGTLTFKPKNNLTRAEAVVMLDKINVDADGVVIPTNPKPTVPTDGSSDNGSDNSSDNDSNSGSPTQSYGVAVTVKTGNSAPKAVFTTDAYASTDKLSDFLVAQTKEVLADVSKSTTIENYLSAMVTKLTDLQIGDTSVNTPEGIAIVKSYLVGTSINTTGIEDALSVGTVTVADLKEVLNSYSTSTVASDWIAISNNLRANPTTIDNNGVEVAEVTFGTTTLTDNVAVADFIDNNITLSTSTVEEFFAKYGSTVSITITVNSKTSTITIQKVGL